MHQSVFPAARRYPGGEEDRGRTIDHAVAAARDFMQRASRQSAAGKSQVDYRDSEREH